MVKRKTYRLRSGDILEVEEFHDGNYGAPGKRRSKKIKPTKEQQEKINKQNKMRRCRQKLLTYFNPGDLFITWTYEQKNRPPTMQQAKKDFQKAIRIVRSEYRKRGQDLFWIRNIERGTKGAWHIHIAINKIEDTATILQKAWKHGGMYISKISLNDKLYDADFTKLASYLTKDENSEERKQDGTLAKPRIKEANYNTSRNMPLPEPKEEKLVRWKEEPKPKKGYHIIKKHEGINPVTGFKYRRYTMVRLDPKEEWIRQTWPGKKCG